MEIINEDGRTFTPRPCPPWCVGDHFTPDVPIDPGDGFHHSSDTIRIETGNVAESSPAVISVWLSSWVRSLEAEPEPPLIAMTIEAIGAADLKPAEARRVAETLVELVNKITDKTRD